MSPRAGCDTLSPRERAGVREHVSTLATACMGRFLESPLFEIGLLTDHEPGIPAGGTLSATDAPFTGSIGDDSRLGARRCIAGEGFI
jgi:hypothetical protein